MKWMRLQPQRWLEILAVHSPWVMATHLTLR